MENRRRRSCRSEKTGPRDRIESLQSLFVQCGHIRKERRASDRRYVVGGSVGGGADSLARAIAQKLVVPRSESRHRLPAGALLLAKSVLGGLHHEYSLATVPAGAWWAIAKQTKECGPRHFCGAQAGDDDRHKYLIHYRDKIFAKRLDISMKALGYRGATLTDSEPEGRCHL